MYLYILLNGCWFEPLIFCAVHYKVLSSTQQELLKADKKPDDDIVKNDASRR